jgi:hypothetical protein
LANARQAVSDAPIQGVLVQEMVAGTWLETIVGVTRDPQFGPVLAFGLGGVLAEALGETALAVLPVRSADVQRILTEGRVGHLVNARRGTRGADVAALEQALLGIVRLANALGDRLLDLEINPLLLRESGQGVVALDCLVRLGPAES